MSDQSPWRLGVRSAIAGLGLAIIALNDACAGEPPRAPVPLRAVDSGRAASIIAHAMSSLHFEPQVGRTIHVAVSSNSEPKELKLTVAAKDHKWGIAFITSAEGERLADVLPHSRDPERFTVLRGVGEGEEDARAVLLFAGDYMEDDSAGEAHTATSIAAEDKLDTHAKKIAREAHDANWP